uniref:NUDIX hydrolase n=1 Tax=Streptomyces sp. ML694-90F3 TaxID=1265536 RepID=A0A077KT29_9ACTN|nr:hypothetical protein [Streptomyces sp. ML694-90F3]
MTRPVSLPGSAPRRRAPYENWRPPIIGVSVLAPVGTTDLLLPCLPGNALVLPTGTVEDGQSPEDAARAVLRGMPDGLPVRRRVAVDQVQMRRRKIITHLVATEPLTPGNCRALAYRDPRATIRVLPVGQALESLHHKVRTRVVLGLQALATGAVIYTEDGQMPQLKAMPPT